MTNEKLQAAYTKAISTNFDDLGGYSRATMVHYDETMEHNFEQFTVRDLRLTTDVPAICQDLDRAGVKALYLAERSTALMEVLTTFMDNGWKVAGHTEVETNKVLKIKDKALILIHD